MSNQLKEKILSYPEEIRMLSFCNWKREKRDGNITKVPYNPLTGGRAQVDAPGTFTTLDRALEALPHYDGIGIRVSGNVGCIDLDDSVLSDGTLTENAQDVLSMLLDAFVEISPSGTGLHLFFIIPEGYSFDADEYYVNNRKNKMENYFPGCTNRFITVTEIIYRTGSMVITAEQLLLFQNTYQMLSMSNSIFGISVSNTSVWKII